MRRAPAKPVRACILRKWCPVSHVTIEAPLRTSHFSLRSSHSTLHASHFALHTSHCTLHTPHFTLHTSHFTLPTAHFTLHTSRFTLLSSHSTLLGYFHVIWAQLNFSHLTEASLNSSRLFCASESLRHRCIYTEKSLQKTLYYKACTKHVPVLLCTTRLAQTTSQY